MQMFPVAIHLPILLAGLAIVRMTGNAKGTQFPSRSLSPRSYESRDRGGVHTRSWTSHGTPNFCCFPAFNGFRPPQSFRHAPVPTLRKRVRNQRGGSASRSSQGNAAGVSPGNVRSRPEASFARDQSKPSISTIQTSPNAHRNAGSVPMVRTRPLPPVSGYYILHRDQANSDNGLRRRLPPYYVPSAHSSPAPSISALVPSPDIQTTPDISSGDRVRPSGNNLQRGSSSAPIGPGLESIPRVKTRPLPPVSGYYILHRDQANSDNGLRRRLPPYYASSDHQDSFTRQTADNPVPVSSANVPSTPEAFSGEDRSTSHNEDIFQRPPSMPVSTGSPNMLSARSRPLPPVSGFYVLHRDQANNDNGLRRRLPPYYVPFDKPVETGKSSTASNHPTAQKQNSKTPSTGAKPTSITDDVKPERAASQKSSDSRDRDPHVPFLATAQNIPEDAVKERAHFVELRQSPERQNAAQRRELQPSEDTKAPQPPSGVVQNPGAKPNLPARDRNKITHEVASTPFELNSPEAVKNINDLIRTRPKDAQNILSRVSASDLAKLVREGSNRHRGEEKMTNARPKKQES